jgi:hypothetical protein
MDGWGSITAVATAWLGHTTTPSLTLLGVAELDLQGTQSNGEHRKNGVTEKLILTEGSMDAVNGRLGLTMATPPSLDDSWWRRHFGDPSINARVAVAPGGFGGSPWPGGGAWIALNWLGGGGKFQGKRWLGLVLLGVAREEFL